MGKGERAGMDSLIPGKAARDPVKSIAKAAPLLFGVFPFPALLFPFSLLRPIPPGQFSGGLLSAKLQAFAGECRPESGSADCSFLFLFLVAGRDTPTHGCTGICHLLSACTSPVN